MLGNMDKIISEAGMPSDNYVAVNVDSIAVNIGSRNSMLTFVRKQNSSTFAHSTARVLSHSEEYQTLTSKV